MTQPTFLGNIGVEIDAQASDGHTLVKETSIER